MRIEPITVYEHQPLRCNDHGQFKEVHLKILQNYYGEKGSPFFSLIHNGVKFCEYVGVLQVKDLTIEVLPKADRKADGSENEWRKLLIDMLRCVGAFTINSTNEADLMLKRHSILDLYIEMFLEELEKLLHHGIIKKYRRMEGNQTALKGSLNFSKHLQYNLIHQERFYVNYTVYNKNNSLNQVLYKTLLLIKSISKNSRLLARINAIRMDFPEVCDIEVNERWFNILRYTRKNEHYKPAIEIAKLLLLNFHPDVRRGKDHVIAIMFDMNLLWEKFIYVSLKKFAPPEMKFKAQVRKPFWESMEGSNAGIKPDIVMCTSNGNYILDTKWKEIEYLRPSDHDLRQMYSYNKYFKSSHAILIYPGKTNEFSPGYFVPKETSDINEGYCSILKISLPTSGVPIRDWQNEIYNYFYYCLTANHFISSIG